MEGAPYGDHRASPGHLSLCGLEFRAKGGAWPIPSAIVCARGRRHQRRDVRARVSRVGRRAATGRTTWPVAAPDGPAHRHRPLAPNATNGDHRSQASATASRRRPTRSGRSSGCGSTPSLRPYPTANAKSGSFATGAISPMPTSPQSWGTTCLELPSAGPPAADPNASGGQIGGQNSLASAPDHSLSALGTLRMLACPEGFEPPTL